MVRKVQVHSLLSELSSLVDSSSCNYVIISVSDKKSGLFPPDFLDVYSDEGYIWPGTQRVRMEVIPKFLQIHDHTPLLTKVGAFDLGDS